MADPAIHEGLARHIPDDPADTRRGHSGLTYAQWQRQRITDYLDGRRPTLSEPYDYEREFIADRDGWMPPLEQVLNTVTGEWYTLTPGERVPVHVDRIDEFVEGFQARFLAEWEARRG